MFIWFARPKDQRTFEKESDFVPIAKSPGTRYMNPVIPFAILPVGDLFGSPVAKFPLMRARLLLLAFVLIILAVKRSDTRLLSATIKRVG